MGQIIKAYMVPHPPIVVPEVGRGQEAPAAATVNAFRTIAGQIRDLAPDVIIITTPHGTVYGDYIHISPDPVLAGDFRAFDASGVKLSFQNDTSLLKNIIDKAEKAGIDAGTLGHTEKFLDHGALVPLYFITKEYQRFKLVRISIAGLPALDLYRFGRCIAEAVAESDLRAIFVASGDLSHRLKDDGPYGFDPHGPEFDRILVDAVRSADFEKLLNMDERLCYRAGECGLRSFIMLAGALNGLDVSTTVHSYEGPFGVGYMVAEVGIGQPNPHRDLISREKRSLAEKMKEIRDNEDPYVALARQTLETYVRTGKTISKPYGLPREMVEKKAGVFVSLKKYGQLRGCIGTIGPTCPCIADEIIQNAISAGTKDPRFNPIKENELDDIVYSVDVLGKPEPVDDISQLDVIRYGVIVSYGYKRGLLLPNLEGVDTVEQQIDIARQKAGIGRDEPYTLERFEVVRHK
ncbi:MAG: AmmeMemoRadiSam system protein A [Clostridiaceae bacterium]|nr:AmmeMemoRadiSam system protein A [Clostridiaceae bacterium]